MGFNRRVVQSLLLLLFGYVNCQSSNELDVNDLEKKLHEIPGLEQFNSSQLPSEEELEKLVKAKCDKNGASEEAFEALKNQQTLLKDCLEQYLNATEIQIEIDEAKKTGSMDEVFGKYCHKYPEVYKCVESVTEAVKPCLDPREQNALKKALNVTTELKEFLCFKDGDRIAMFIAEGGIECLDSRKDALQECANKTLGSRIPTDISVNNLPVFLFSERDCSDFDKIRICFNTELEKCQESTPANIVDAFFKFLKKHTPCDQLKVAETLTKAAEGSSSTTLTISTLISLSTFIISRVL